MSSADTKGIARKLKYEIVTGGTVLVLAFSAAHLLPMELWLRVLYDHRSSQLDEVLFTFIVLSIVFPAFAVIRWREFWREGVRHDAGDAVLSTLGGFLLRQMRGGDIPCRYGGEEFALVLSGTTREVAQRRAEEICEGIRSLTVNARGQSLGPLTVSVGVASFPEQGDTETAVLKAADTALYHAKHGGRDRVACAA
jgi:GGDEF domain-containing protein